MGDFRLEDLWAIIQGLLIVVVGGFLLFATIALWPKISVFVRAAWRRYVVFSWDELMERVADVNDYGDIMSLGQAGSIPDRPSSNGGSLRVEPAQIAETYQVEPSAPPICAPLIAPPPISHNMSKKELTILLAVQKDSDGQYRYSANRIAGFIGGTSAEVKGWVAEVRGKKESPANTLRRPEGGWGKAS